MEDNSKDAHTVHQFPHVIWQPQFPLLPSLPAWGQIWVRSALYNMALSGVWGRVHVQITGRTFSDLLHNHNNQLKVSPFPSGKGTVSRGRPKAHTPFRKHSWDTFLAARHLYPLLTDQMAHRQQGGHGALPPILDYPRHLGVGASVNCTNDSEASHLIMPVPLCSEKCRQGH